MNLAALFHAGFLYSAASIFFAVVSIIALIYLHLIYKELKGEEIQVEEITEEDIVRERYKKAGVPLVIDKIMVG